ncbi:FecR family protein [Roseivirga sp. E12]|uniref:FecR family protein n=1 Tax=Roseivirga sp. E12 TaxID=2819237 RepID=UPI001ABC0103|nr:FecR family protein [Roseivirga sp. E12]MBO3697705.1 FecR domain-containing protein [Roseivirga sp. E12]
MEDKNLIYHFLKEDCSPEELDQLHEWLISDLDEETTNDLLKSLWKKTHDGNIHDIDEAGLTTKIRSEIASKNGFVQTKTPKKRVIVRNRRNNSWVIITAILALVITAGYFITSQNTVTDQEPFLAGQIEKNTPRGHRSTVNLRDGSRVILNSETKITYDENFGIDNRRITLEGEAFFEVARDENLPFIVTSKNLITRALGTSFNVRDYGDEDSASIALATGKVKVKRSKNPTNKFKIFLSPNEQVVLIKASQKWSKSTFQPERVLSWKDNSLNFEDMSLARIIRTLERWYDVNIEVRGEGFEKLTYEGTGSFERQSLENILNTLGYTMGFESTINEKQIMIKLTN